MEGKRPRGRPRMGMIDCALDETYGDMKRKAENLENWRILKPRTLGQRTNDDDDDDNVQSDCRRMIVC